MTPNDAPKLAPLPGPLAGLVFLFLIVNGATLWFLGSRLASTQRHLDHLENVINRWNYVRVRELHGYGFNACLDYLSHWAPKLQTAGLHDVAEVRQRVESCVEAIADMGPDIYPLIQKAYLPGQSLSNDTATDDEVRSWLLVAARGADRERGTELIARTIRANDFEVSTRLRLMATDLLLKGDKEDVKRAGELLHDVLATETVAGSRPGIDRKKIRGAKGQFFQFVDRYASTGDPRLEETLIMILGRAEHDRPTVQEAVKQLGDLQSTQAARQIESLFWNPRWRTKDNQLFRRNCLLALEKILCARMLPMLNEANAKEKDPFVRQTILNLIKQLSGNGSGNGGGQGEERKGAKRKGR